AQPHICHVTSCPIDSKSGMTIDELRGWAAFMDKAVIASVVATVLGASSLGITTWLSLRMSADMRARQQAAFEKEAATTRWRPAALEHDVSEARDRASALEQEAAAARDRAATFGQAAREAN